MRCSRGWIIAAAAGVWLAVCPAVSASTAGGAVSWGTGEAGQLGDGLGGGPEANRPIPVAVSGLGDVTGVAGLGKGAVALLGDGTVVAWGSNEDGQLGDGTFEPSLVPTPVAGLSEVTAVSAGWGTAMALLSDGTVEAWGANEHGQLGDGSTENSDVPVPVSGLTGVTAIASGGTFSLALLSDGTVMAWGDNERGQLGNGTTKDSDVPVPVSKLGAVKAIAAGGHDTFSAPGFALALLEKGTVKAWGGNGLGQLGDGELLDSHVPVEVEGLESVVSISAGLRHSLARLVGGSVVAWGFNEYGELGNGRSAPEQEFSAVPVGVKGLAEATKAVSAGDEESLALLNDGTVEAWGMNQNGALGIGTTTAEQLFSVAPVHVCGLSEVRGVAAGTHVNYAFDLPSQPLCPTVAGLSTNLGPIAGGTPVTITGSEFTGATTVYFGSSAVSEFTVNSPTSISVIAPAHAAGSTRVRVQTPTGTSGELESKGVAGGITSESNLFQYLSPPTLSKLKPNNGPTAGATSVTITGSNFVAGSTSVTFGSNAGTGVVVKSPTSLTVVSPPEPAGKVDVRVTTPGGTSAITKADAFKFTPTIKELKPNNGPTAGGNSVTILGAGFAVAPKATAVKFGTAKATTVSCPTTEECTAIAPAHSAGKVDLKVTVNKTSSAKTTADQYAYG
jgi:alpha-tubulin suppressor-like RCC1 family protein